MEDARRGTVLGQEGVEIDEFLINRVDRRYGLNEYRNSLGRKLKQTGEYVKMRPMTEYKFLEKGIVHYLVYMYLCGLMVKDSLGGYKTIKKKFLTQQMYFEFGCKFTEEEIQSAYDYLLREHFIHEIYDGVKYPAGLQDPDCQVWITSKEVIFTFEAMMQEKERKNRKQQGGQEQ